MIFEIKKLEPALLEDYLDFFDNRAFCDNPHWATCYCYYYKYDCSNEEWFDRSSKENRDAVTALIQEGKLKGYLAYIDGMVVGWCHGDDLTSFPRMKELFRENEKIATIVCYVIDPQYRRKGIATSLMEYACTDLKNAGYSHLEVHPTVKKDGNDADNYHGPLSMYLNHGFEIVERCTGFYRLRRAL